MKNKFANIILCASLLLASSCQKDQVQNITKSITVNLKVNQTYTYTFPSTGDNRTPLITLQAQHFESSNITTDANGIRSFTYIPLTNFTGADAVHVTANDVDDPNNNQSGCGNTQGGQNGCFGNNGCDHHHHSIQTNVTYVFNITVSGDGSGIPQKSSFIGTGRF
ncbi:MAG TPA: hypothetical protein VE978_24985 [Chitinophagales bacterium]|nr:hypothetical protein [Chitinophagales bacterium]